MSGNAMHAAGTHSLVVEWLSNNTLSRLPYLLQCSQDVSPLTGEKFGTREGLVLMYDVLYRAYGVLWR